jgi:glucose-1-phosphate cytidylyltransferase
MGRKWMMDSKVTVVILCGGLGARLREETEFRPKPMVKIGNQPILWHIMKLYSYFGFHRFVLCLGYKGDMIKEYFYNYELMNNDVTITLGSNKKFKIHGFHDECGWEVTLSHTGDNAFKGARLKRVEKYVDTELFMVTYGDGIANVNLHQLLQFHRAHGKLATLTGVRPKFLRFGELDIREEQVIRFTEKPRYSGNYINGGFYVFNRAIFDYLEDRDECDLETDTLEKISEQGELMVYKHDDFWACMDTIRDVDYLNELWNTHHAEWKIW